MGYKLPLLFFSLIFLLPTSHFAQETYTYDSIYQPAPGLTGKATFPYKVNRDGERIKDGKFVFVRDVKDSLTATTATYHNWEGVYSNNKKSGQWVYETRNHQVKINDISDVNLDYRILTEDEILTIDYIDGTPQGEVSLESVLYSNRQRLKQLKYLKVNFRNGLIDGQVEMRIANEERDRFSLLGSARNGLMHGFWEFNYFDENITETREYDRGILLKLTRELDGRIIEEIEFPLSEGLTAVLANESREVELVNNPLSLNFSDGYPRTSKYMNSQKEGEELLQNLLVEIFKFDEHQLEDRLPLGTNRGFYPLSSEERKSLEKWTEVEENFRRNIEQLNNMEVDNIELATDDEVKVVLAWVDRQEELREYMRPWNNILSKDQVEVYNREGLLVDYAYNILARDTLIINGNEQIFEYQPREKGDNFLNYIVANLEDRNKYADSLIAEFAEAVQDVRVSREITGLNENIVQQKARLDSLLNTSSGYGKLDDLVYTTSNHYRRNIYPESLEEFQNSQNNEEQIKIGNELSGNLNILFSIYTYRNEIAERREEIDELYTEYTFDPFTYSDQVPTRKKRRLYNYVTEQVIEKILERAENNYTRAREVLKELQLVRRMQERLIFMEDKDTSRLERRLQRSRSLQESVDLLNSL